jgi:hypothetical protein
VQQPSAHGCDAIDALARSIDEALGLLRRGRYPEMEAHFRRFEQQAQGLEALKRALEKGSRAPSGIRESCEQLGRRLLVFSEVARQVAKVEFGVVQLLAGPRDSSYGRNGHCEEHGGSHFEQEA